jgi:hypothetical protein
VMFTDGADRRASTNSGNSAAWLSGICHHCTV